MIQINILAHSSDRFIFTSKALDFLKKIKDENKSKIKVLIVPTKDSERWTNKVNELREYNIDSVLLPDFGQGDNYLSKIDAIINSTDCRYSCSMDDDILISSHLWDYIIENIDVLENDSNLFLAPLISNGIPSVDLFIDDFFEEPNKSEIKEIFRNTKIENYWDVDYSGLNRDREQWDLSYYNDVSEIDHYYKGIHPIRISIDAHKKMAEFICLNPDKMMSKNDYRIEKHKFPYFCNSFYFIKTSTWGKIIKDRSLFRDPYDEVPLNLYMQNKDLNMVFIRGGFCLHMAYNTIGNIEQKKIESYYLENFINKI
jgi:hypothetical protein